ncbi:tyrosine-protein phosphatase [Rhodococcus spelaei]|uniref:Tyrosine-protein phosphatase n=1 Tax=Rhodococcus spelaei TaxID=2546320 RepID=A0A541B133_9NOCA|nr:tyrosine-protein phosphatase [Rhodococcus spelaei]TQF66020.1 tyrosine-protein phosphatase [Rhodococcus spelaei]
MSNSPAVGASIPISSVPNLRDAGGYRTADGSRVRTGLVYRSTDLGRVVDEDVAALDALGITTVFDLRTVAEREMLPDRAPTGAKEVPLDVLADRDPSAAPAMMQKILTDPALAEQLLGTGDTNEHLLGSYREFVSLPSAVASYRALFTDLARHDDTPVLIHCTTGKDRTGWAVAALLLFLGVDEDTVFTEYLLTNEQLLPSFTPVFDKFRAAGGNPDILLPILGVRRAYLEAALDQVRTDFGDVETYLSKGLELDAGDLRALQERLLSRD